ncbi:MAG: hypothetical protein LLG04_01615 [Parachlamydia sp.]|nr:hypothetical protein [Parachlamydia sp.]
MTFPAQMRPAGPAATPALEPSPNLPTVFSAAAALCPTPSFSPAQMQYLSYHETWIAQKKKSVHLFVNTNSVQTQSVAPGQDLQRAIEYLQAKGTIHSYRCGQDLKTFFIIVNLSKEEQEWYRTIRNKIQARKLDEAVEMDRSLNSTSEWRVLDFCLLRREIQATV